MKLQRGVALPVQHRVVPSSVKNARIIRANILILVRITAGINPDNIQHSLMAVTKWKNSIELHLKRTDIVTRSFDLMVSGATSSAGFHSPVAVIESLRVREAVFHSP